MSSTPEKQRVTPPKFHARTITIPRKVHSKISAEDFCDLHFPEDLKISPNGTNVIYSVRRATKEGNLDRQSIWLATTGKDKSAQQLTSGLYYDRHARWSPNGESIAFLSDRASPGQSCAIYILPLLGPGGEAYPLTSISNEAEIESFRWSPDGHCIAYISADEKDAARRHREHVLDDVQVVGADWEYNRLRVVHVNTTTTATFYSKENHVSHFAWSEDSKEIVYVLYDTPSPDSPSELGAIFELYSIVNKQSWHVAHFPGRINGDLAWSKAGISFVAGTAPEKAFTSQATYTLLLSDSSFTKTSNNDETCVDSTRLPPGLGHGMYVLEQSNLVDNLVHDTTGRQLYSGRHHIASWDVSANEPENTFTLVMCKSSVSAPPEVFSLTMANDRRFGEHKRTAGPDDLVQLSDHSAHISLQQLATCQNLRCPSSDGTTQIEALFVSPTALANDVSALSKPLPTIVWAHGGPYSRVNNRFDQANDSMSSYLTASERYGVLLPNYRGSSARGETFASQARGKMGSLDYDDIIALVDKAIQRGLVDRDRIMIAGWGQGGFLAYLCAVRNGTQNGWRFRGAICGGGVADVDALAGTANASQIAAELSGTAPWKAGKTEVSSRQGSPIWEMSTAKDMPPVLILHGAADEFIPVSQSRLFHRGCSYYNYPCEMAVYPREGHFVRERMHKIDLLKRLRRFCDLHMSL